MHFLTTSLLLILSALTSSVFAASIVAQAEGHLTKLSLESGFIGIVLIVLGIILAFAGKRFFQPFLGIVGFLAFGLIGFTLLELIDNWWSFGEHYQLYLLIGSVVCGLLGAAICIMAWKVGIYLGAALGGFSLGTFLMTLKAGGTIADKFGRPLFLAVCVSSFVVLAFFFDEIIVVLASALAGAFTLICGIDCFVKTGLNDQLIAFVKTQDLQHIKFTGDTYMMIIAIAVVAIFAVVVQFLFPTRGFGTKD